LSIRRHLLLLALVAASSGLCAAEKKLYIDVADFAARRAEIDTVLADPTRYAELTRTQREEVRSALDRMQKHLEDAGSVEGLGPNAKMRVFNDQEIINTMLAQAAAGSRTVCKAERRTGSNMVKRRCRTVAEIERTRAESQQGLRRLGESLPPPKIGNQ
jgi:hypothetical protein